jgi:hypothetical protein
LDILIFYGILTLISVFVVAGVFSDKMLLGFAGLVVILLGLAIANGPITEERVTSYSQTNTNAVLNNSAYENLTSAFANQTGTVYSIRGYPVVANYSRVYTYISATIMNQSWQYGLITSGVGAGLVLVAFI